MSCIWIICKFKIIMCIGYHAEKKLEKHDKILTRKLILYSFYVNSVLSM